MDVLNRIIVDAYEKSGSPLNKEKAQKSLDAIFEDYISKNPMYDLFSLNSRENYLEACNWEIKFLERVLMEDPETAANIIKIMYINTGQPLKEEQQHGNRTQHSVIFNTF